MKKVFMSFAVVAAMFAVASCACCNNSEKASEAPAECCAACDSTKACCDSTACQACDSTACCKKAE